MACEESLSVEDRGNDVEEAYRFGGSGFYAHGGVCMCEVLRMAERGYERGEVVIA